MSAVRPLLANTLPASAPTPPPSRHLRPVDAPARRRPRLAYGITAVAGVLAIAACQMGLSIATSQASFELSQLSQTNRELTWQSQALADEVAGIASPQYLAANASALGMVVGASPTFLRLSDGAIIGTGDAPMSSTVDAAGRGVVANALISQTPLVTAPESTLQGAPEAVEPTVGATLPPPISDGLPTPSTH